MHITFIHENLAIKGGLERIICEKMNAFADVPDMKVTFVEIFAHDNADCYHTSAKVNRASLGIRKTHNWLLKPMMLPLLWVRLRRTLRREQPDIVSVSTLWGLIMASLMIGILRPKRTTKVIFESHSPRHRLLLKFLLPRMERNVDCIVALTRGDAEEWKVCRRVEVIHNFCPSLASDNTKHEAPRTDKPTKRRCIAIGRLSEQKNFAALIDIWKRVNERHPDWHLDIIGDGPLHDDLQRQIDDNALSTAITLQPFTERISEEYDTADILLMTSLYEGLPMTLIEAQTHGLPIVAFDCDYGPRDVITHGEDGYLIAPGDNNAFTDAVSRLICNDTMRTAMGNEALSSASRFSKERIIRQWMREFSPTPTPPEGGDNR